MPRTLAAALVLLAACSGAPGPSGRSSEDAGSAQPPLAGGATTPVEPPAVGGTPTTPAEPPPLAGRLAVTDGAGGTGPFRIGAVSRLQLDAACTAARPGPHTLRLEVVSPSGTVYASVPEQVVVTDAGTAAVSRALAVRGTTIETFLRTGTWHFTFTLDGGDPLATADVDLTE